MLWFSIAIPLHSQEKIVSIQKRGNNVVDIEANHISTTIFSVTNLTSKKQKWQPSTILPAGWKIISKNALFELDPNQFEIKMVSFLIPQATPADKYKIRYQLTSEPLGEFDSEFFVVIRPIKIIALELLKEPVFIIAGIEYELDVKLTNESNILANVKLEVESDINLLSSFPDTIIHINPGKFIFFTIAIQTDEEIDSNIRHDLTLTAYFIDDKNIESHLKSSVEIIPQKLNLPKSKTSKPYTAAFRLVNRNDMVNGVGFQANVYGRSHLDKDKKKQIDFQLRGPNSDEYSIFTHQEEYRFKYSGSQYSYHLGDQSFSLSQLSQNYRYGRGFAGQIKKNNYHFGGYLMESKFINPQERAMALYSAFKINEDTHIKLNYLKKSSQGIAGRVASLEAGIEPLKNLKMNWEYGLSKIRNKKNHAYLFDVKGSHLKTIYYLKYIHADPDFAGYYENIDLYSAGLSIQPATFIQTNVSFGRQKSDSNISESTFFLAR